MEGRREIKALVFDMDGLLFDSERIVQRSWQKAGEQLGYPAMGNQIYQTLGMNLAGRNEYFRRAIGRDFPCDEFTRKAREHFFCIVSKEGLPMKPGAQELLAYAKEKGYRIGIATSSRREYARNNLEQAGILSYFDAGVYGDMVERAKPDPEIYLRACGCLGMDPAVCMALEDAPAGIRSAYAAGLLPVAVPDLVYPPEEIHPMIHKICKTLRDVILVLEEMGSERRRPIFPSGRKPRMEGPGLNG